MLKHEDSPQAPPAAKVRVTPEELAAALSRLEAQKEAGQRQADGTIPLGEAVQELGLNTTPEELLQEIEAGRARFQENHLQTPWPQAKRMRVGIACALALLLSGGMVFSVHPSAPAPSAAILPATAIVLPAAQATPKTISLDPNLLVITASGKLVMLSEVGDNQPVQCFYNDDDRSFQSYSSENPTVRKSWTLIKHSGQVYVRGWIGPISDQAMRKYGVYIGTWESDLIDSDPSHTSHNQITIPLNGFQIGSGGRSDMEFHAVNIHLDKHAYEKWQP